MSMSPPNVTLLIENPWIGSTHGPGLDRFDGGEFASIAANLAILSSVRCDSTSDRTLLSQRAIDQRALRRLRRRRPHAHRLTNQSSPNSLGAKNRPTRWRAAR